ncbi:hypothetical protein CSA37_04880 [Candidatus Fermentibacteria bacterium]|nr:MAG: hypothetical protein CSA37_10170 [Candidatus Fermentibacteria bacterium]PIE52263.1 MAG: hypothetical protein CSA37_07275 [Candidatus Fermentibacteria bacterium]PIE52758.1 MAG: hypothetical protein CSA37_04880 [Candidatus Fermentibacteria bacterium]
MKFVEEKQRQQEQLRAAIKMIRDAQEKLPLKPAIVSWLRIILLPFCVISGWQGSYHVMFWTALVCAASDYADGWLARRLKVVSTPGKTLDMLADKLFLSVMLIMLARLSAITHEFALITAWYHIIVVLGLLLVSWSIRIPVVAITTSERLTVILSYVLVVASCGSLAFSDKSIFIKVSHATAILTPIAAVIGIASYFRLSRRLIQRYLG